MERDEANITIITNDNYEQFIGMDIAAFLDSGLDSGSEYIDIIDMDGRRYRLMDVSEGILYKILPCIKESIDADLDFAEETDDGYFIGSYGPCKGWYKSDQRVGPMEHARYLWYTKDVSVLLNNNQKEINRIWNKHQIENEDDIPEAIDVIRQVIVYDHSMRQRKLDRLKEKENTEKILYSEGDRIVVANAKARRSFLERKFPGCLICDVSSESKDEEYAKFSPTYKHGDIPVPSSNKTKDSVDTIWENSMVLNVAGDNKTPKKLVGHMYGGRMISLIQGREMIFVPTYNWILENRLKDECLKLKVISSERVVVLLDDVVNGDIDDISEPLSHASLIKRYIESLQGNKPVDRMIASESNDERIVMLQHAHKNIPFDTPFYMEQCKDLPERMVFDVTSRNPSRTFARQISPMYIGPVITGDGMDAECFELFWQCSKLYPCHSADGQPTEEYWDYRRRMFGIKPYQMSNMDKRYPNRMLGHKTSDCVCNIWYNKETKKYERLGYVASRKKEYIPEYARLVHDTDAFKYIKKVYESGRKIALVDFDVYNYASQGKSLSDVINDGSRAAGHGYVIKMLIEGSLEVIDGEVVDHMGILEPISELERMASEVTSQPDMVAQVDQHKDSWRKGSNVKVSSDRITPERVTSLTTDQIFVFGSNISGKHVGGAARTAYKSFGAVMGQGEGIQGQSYAIPTMNRSLGQIKSSVDNFISYAEGHPGKRFLVTKIGCGIGGFRAEEIAPLFEKAVDVQNIYLPEDFWKVLQSLGQG